MTFIPKEPRSLKMPRLAAMTVAVAAVVAGATGIAAGQGKAAPALRADKAAHSHKAERFKHPKLKHGLLTIKGTRADDRIALRLQAGASGILQVDVGDDGSADFSFARTNMTRIAVDARAGEDSVRIDESNGIFTDTISTTIDGGDGNDNLAGGSGSETLLGSDGNDAIDGNRGSDVASMGRGDDTFVWDPGDGSDTVDGQSGEDTMRFNGANVSERFDASANGNRLRFVRDIGNITMDTHDVEQVDVNALGGADLVTVNDLTGTGVDKLNVDLGASGGAGDGQTDDIVVNGTNGNDTILVDGDASGVNVSGLPAVVAIRHQDPTDQLAVNGLDGNDSISAAALAAQSIALTLGGGGSGDRIAGGRGVETLAGGDGNDSLDGNGGNDLALMGAGDDTFVWDPGDGSDTVEGQDGADTMRFNGASIAEQIDLSPNGGRLRLVRNIGTITMDTDGVETVDVRALGGADTVTANDLAGTDVTSVETDLAAAGGGGDGQPDRVIVNGTSGADTITAAGGAGTANVTGLAAAVSVTSAEPAGDTLTINALAGTDRVDASGLAATALELELNGGDDVDVLIGSAGGDVIDGNRGNDLALLGSGDDTFVWDPGDGSDTVEGQDGADTMRFNGANVGEQFTAAANGSRLRFFRDIGNITMDTDGVEQVDLNTLGGADLVTVNDLAGTDVSNVNVDLAAAGGAGDGQADRVVVNGTDGDDTIKVNGEPRSVTAAGLAATIAVLHPEAANDRLEVDTLAGTDTVNAGGLAAGLIQLFVDGVRVS